MLKFYRDRTFISLQFETNKTELKRLFFSNFLSKFKLLTEKREFWGKLKKRNTQSLRLTMIQRKFWHKSKIKLFNGYWTPSLFESVPMDKV